MYRFSHRLAWVAGVALPVGETLRRWGTWWEFPPAYIDDLLIGAFFLLAAWTAGRQPGVGPKWLAAAYGFACGIGFTSLALTLADLRQPDPAGVSGATAAVVKAVMLACGAAGLAGALGGSDPAVRQDVTRIG